MVVGPSGVSYADSAAAKTNARKNKKREEFPHLRTRKNVSVKSRLGLAKPITNSGKNPPASKTRDRVRTARVGPRFETTTGDEGWKELRSSIEQKLQNPKIRTI